MRARATPNAEPSRHHNSPQCTAGGLPHLRDVDCDTRRCRLAAQATDREPHAVGRTGTESEFENARKEYEGTGAGGGGDRTERTNLGDLPPSTTRSPTGGKKSAALACGGRPRMKADRRHYAQEG